MTRAVEIGAVDADSGVLKALKNVGFGQAEGSSGAHRDQGKGFTAARISGVVDVALP